MEAVDFTINQKPVSISLVCPYCEFDMEIPWDEVNAPEYWGDAWKPITCPCCGERIELGDYYCN